MNMFPKKAAPKWIQMVCYHMLSNIIIQSPRISNLLMVKEDHPLNKVQSTHHKSYQTWPYNLNVHCWTYMGMCPNPGTLVNTKIAGISACSPPSKKCRSIRKRDTSRNYTINMCLIYGRIWKWGIPWYTPRNCYSLGKFKSWLAIKFGGNPQTNPQNSLIVYATYIYMAYIYLYLNI